jgi:hypothetical protein
VLNGVTLACVFVVVLGVYACGVAFDHRREWRRGA